MRRVNIKSGLKQRIPDILGTDSSGSEPLDPSDSNVSDITPWSIQAAMLSNCKRIVSAIVGTAAGRPMKGLTIAKKTNTEFTIEPGIGFTPEGNVIVLSTQISISIPSGISSGVRYVYLKHFLGTIDGNLSTNPEGKSTGFIGEAYNKNIVFDDLATALKDGVSSRKNDIVIQQSTVANDPTGLIYLGSIQISGSIISSITNSTSVGFVDNPNNPYAEFTFTAKVQGTNDVFTFSVALQGKVCTIAWPRINFTAGQAPNTDVTFIPNPPSGIEMPSNIRPVAQIGSTGALAMDNPGGTVLLPGKIVIKEKTNSSVYFIMSFNTCMFIEAGSFTYYIQ